MDFCSACNEFSVQKPDETGAFALVFFAARIEVDAKRVQGTVGA